MSGAMDHQLHHASGTVAASSPHAAGHTMLEDIYGMAVGMMFIVTGVVLLSAAGLVTGGIAGIALLVSYVAPIADAPGHHRVAQHERDRSVVLAVGCLLKVGSAGR